MAAHNTSSPFPACNCADSPLSITASTTGILTFALVVWASILYCFRSVRDFEQEMHDMQHRVQVAFEDALRLRRTFIEKQRVSPSWPPRPAESYHELETAENGRPRQPQVQRYPYLIDEAWARAEKEMIKAAKFVNKRLLKPTTVLSVLGSRAAYVIERKNAAATVERLERAMENVKGIVADVFGQISTETDFRVMQLEADVAELQRQIEDMCELLKQVLDVTTARVRNKDIPFK